MTTLDSLANIYQQKVLSFLGFCKGKTVVFDFDGTLTDFKYGENSILPCPEKDLPEYFSKPDLKIRLFPLQTMQWVIEELIHSGSDIYIITVSALFLEKPKNYAIHKMYPMIPMENVYHVRYSGAKTEVLRHIHEEKDKPIVFVEDKAETLMQAEEALDFVQGFHISSIIP